MAFEADVLLLDRQRLAARESSSSAMPGSLLGRDEDGRVGYETEPWNHRQPQAYPDLHHDQPIVFGTGDTAKVMWQQATPMHTSGARYRARAPYSRVKRLTEREAHEINRQLDRAGITDVTHQALLLDAEGYTNREIAERLGLTLDSVKSRLKKAKQRLQRAAG
jgi:DNA-binding CsgD family transcriptional regulator